MRCGCRSQADSDCVHDGVKIVARKWSSRVSSSKKTCRVHCDRSRKRSRERGRVLCDSCRRWMRLSSNLGLAWRVEATEGGKKSFYWCPTVCQNDMAPICQIQMPRKQRPCVYLYEYMWDRLCKRERHGWKSVDRIGRHYWTVTSSHELSQR